MVLNDYIAGYIGAAGILAALRRRAREGGSYHVRISLSRAAMWFMSLGSFPTTDFDPTAPDHRMIPLRTMRARTPYGEVDRLAPQVEAVENAGTVARAACRRSRRRFASLGRLRDLTSSREVRNGGGADLRAGLGSVVRVTIAVFLLALTGRAALAQSAAPAPVLPTLTLPPSITNPPPDLLDGTLSGLGDEEEDDSPKAHGFAFRALCNRGWISSKRCCSSSTAS